MAERSLETLVDQLHRIATNRDQSSADGALLERFLRSHDEAAFELILWRHGAMVHAVCQRVLGRCGEVDDAFQATFIVLLRQSHWLCGHDSLAGWLHGVAFRVAHRCRRNLQTRQRHERKAVRPEAQYPPDFDTSDLGQILHAEIERLPERLRLPFVLCELEGRTNAETAVLLAVPYGTVLSRLSRARERLRRRLTQRGVALGAAGFASALVVEPVSAGLIASAVQGVFKITTGTAIAVPVAALAKGVIRLMFVRRLKLIVVGLLAASVVCGVSLTVASHLASTAKAADTAVKPDDPARAKAATPPSDSGSRRATAGVDDGPQAPKAEDKSSPQSPLDLMMSTKPLAVMHPDEIGMIGVWQLTEEFVGGEPRDPEDTVLTIGAFGTMLIKKGIATAKEVPMTYRFDPHAKPPTIDLTAGGKTQRGVYSLRDDNLQICLSVSSAARPNSLNSVQGSDAVLFRLVRLSNRRFDTKWADKLFENGPSHDFGQVRDEEKPVHKFKFKNIYGRPIRINRPLGGWGGPDTGVKTFRISPQTWDWIEPGQESEVEIQVIEPKGLQSGPITEAVGSRRMAMARNEHKLSLAVQFVIKGVDRQQVKREDEAGAPEEGDLTKSAGSAGRIARAGGRQGPGSRVSGSSPFTTPETIGSSTATLTVTATYAGEKTK